MLSTEEMFLYSDDNLSHKIVTYKFKKKKRNWTEQTQNEYITFNKYMLKNCIFFKADSLEG